MSRATILVVLAALVAACSGTATTTTSTPPTTGRAAAIGSCPLGTLTVEPGLAEGAAGHSFQPVVFTNAGDTACEPVDPVGLVVTGPDGRELPAVIDAGLSAGTRPFDGRLEPGESATVVLETRNACTAGQRPHPVGETFRLVFPGEVTVDVAASLDPACGVGMSEFTGGL
jgi:hypothetical protein